VLLGGSLSGPSPVGRGHGTMVDRHGVTYSFRTVSISTIWLNVTFQTETADEYLPDMTQYDVIGGLLGLGIPYMAFKRPGVRLPSAPPRKFKGLTKTG